MPGTSSSQNFHLPVSAENTNTNAQTCTSVLVGCFKQGRAQRAVAIHFTRFKVALIIGGGG